MIIGIRDLEMRGWMAGGVVARTMVMALSAAGAEVRFITSCESRIPAGIKGVIVPESSYWPGEWTLRQLLKCGPKRMLADAARRAGVDVLLPMMGSERVEGLPSIGWIPDFQHRHLPELFSGDRRALLDREFEALAAHSSRVLLSSFSVQKDFERYLPHLSWKTKVAPFPSLFAFESDGHQAGGFIERFGLPGRFLLMINQFWRHKNHRVVVDALARAKAQGLRVPLVMAGLPTDFRDPENSYLSETFQAMAEGGISDQCVFLGKLPREGLCDLLRAATLLVQPSRFEGWNTTLQDAKALGCPVVVSDLPVHREQCPAAVGYFGPGAPEQLAEILVGQWDQLPQRPDPAGETAALVREKESANEYAETLQELCRECLR